MMPKSDTIEAIRKLNPTARPDFLAGFSNNELAEYLDRLAGARHARPRCRVVDIFELEAPLTVSDPVLSGCRDPEPVGS